MRKQEYKEQEQKRPRRYYFFDYLFWLGEVLVGRNGAAALQRRATSARRG